MGSRLRFRNISDTFQVGIKLTNTFTNLDTNGTGVSTEPGVVDLTDFSEVRFSAYVNTAGVTGQMKLQWSDVSTSEDLTSAVSLATTGTIKSEWEAIPAEARRPVSLSALAFNGNSTESPEVYFIVAYFRV